MVPWRLARPPRDPPGVSPGVPDLVPDPMLRSARGGGGFVAALAERILLCDGAIGTMLAADLPEALTLTRPALVERLHRRYLDAGAEALTTNTFGASAVVLADHGLGNRAFELNRRAAELARGVADAARATGRNCFVLGSMGPTNRTLGVSPDRPRSSLGTISRAELRSAYRTQAAGLLAGGADLLLVETCFDTDNARTALDAAREALRGAPGDPGILVSFTATGRNGRNRTGDDAGSFWNAVSGPGITAAAVNCSFGIEGLRSSLELLARAAPVPVGALPSAGLPDRSGAWPESPVETARALGALVRAGLADFVGGCCGTTPETIAAIRAELRGTRPRRLPGRG